MFDLMVFQILKVRVRFI